MQSYYMVGHVLQTGQLAAGNYVAAVEQLVAVKSGTEFGVAVNSATSGLQLLLEADTEPGDKVAVPAFTMAGTVNAVINAQCEPVICDVGDDRLLDPAKVPDDVDAVLPVHLYGALAHTGYSVPVVEDAAQAIGHNIGSGVISLYGSKTVGAGEGGVVVTNDASAAGYVALLADQGQDGKYHHVAPGYNMRLTDLQAAVVVPQLIGLEDTLNQRRQNADYLWEQFFDLPVVLPNPVDHTFHQFVVEVPNRTQVREFMLAKGVETAVHYPKALSEFDWLEAPHCPTAERLAAEVLSLPVHEHLTAGQLEHVATTFREAITVLV